MASYYLKCLTNKNGNLHDLAKSKEVRKISKIMIAIIVVVFLIIVVTCGQKIIGEYINKYVLFFDSQNDVEECIDLLEENNLNYNILFDRTSVRIENENDFDSAINLLEENQINFGYVVNE